MKKENRTLKNKKSYYLFFRNKYIPENIRVIFVLESPPKSGKYFYNNDGRVSEPLFAAMMKAINCDARDKETGLQSFKKKGFIIVDATYVPVNNLNGKPRDEKILQNYQNLVEDLKNLLSGNNIPLIFVKANICRLLEPKLKKDGFNVLNNGVLIPFPSCGQQGNFKEKLAFVLKKANFAV